VDIEGITKLITPILKQKNAKKAILFGSYARGTNDKHSDIDLIIVDNDQLPYLRRLDKYFNELSSVLSAPLEIFIYQEAEFERMKEGAFVGRAVEEGIIIYEQ
jgi:predicted nucleotidyltransferase